MKDEIILKKAIEKALKNGWDRANKEFWIAQTAILLEDNQVMNVIFNHKFAKAFWGEKLINLGGVKWLPWQYHLREMVLEEEPIKYLEKFLK